MPTTIKIKTGETLGGLAKQHSTTVQDIMSLNPQIKDPNKIFAGSSLRLPELAGTLPKEGDEVGETGPKNLPRQGIDGLSRFEDVLRFTTQRATQESISKGIKGIPKGVFPDTSKVSGGTFAGSLRFISEEKTRGISDIYESTLKMFEDARKQGDRQLSLLVSTGAIADLSDVDLEKLSTITETPLEYLESIRNVKKEEKTAGEKMTDAGRISETNTFFSDKIGGDGKISAKSYLEGFKNWIGLGGGITDFKFAYPVEQWLGEHEFGNLPSNFRPAVGPTVPEFKTLPAENQVFVNRVQEQIDNLELTFSEAVEKYQEIAPYLKASK